MSDNEPPLPEKDQKVWARMIGRRKQEWQSLPKSELVAIIEPMWNSESTPPVYEDPWERVEYLLKRYFRQSIDRNLSPDTRRSAWDSLNLLLQKLDGKESL